MRQRSAPPILVAAVAVDDLAGVSLGPAASPVGRVARQPRRAAARRAGIRLGAVARLAVVLAAELGARAALAPEAAAVAPFAGALAVAVLRAACAVGAPGLVAGADALPADAGGTVDPVPAKEESWSAYGFGDGE